MFRLKAVALPLILLATADSLQQCANNADTYLSNRAEATNTTIKVGHDLVPYATGAKITPEAIDRLKHYGPQSRESVQQILQTSPTWVSEDREIYEVQGDHIAANQRFVIFYKRHESCNFDCYKAVEWHYE